MLFNTINQDMLNQLCFAFDSCLLERNLSFQHTKIVEENGTLFYTFCNDPEKARSVEFDGQHCLGLEMDYIAAEVLLPILPRLKAYAI
ncbi:hypothetical protein [Bacillus sp. 1P06AnD]|uniref:hypothetical protein n=1 Tax=Bacillus sp. 1P06AnD TaxID=3132208 RepID=UPI0039A31525